MCLLQVTMCSVKVQRQWLSFLSPPSSFSWRQNVRSLAFQLSSETRYCKIDLEMYTTSINLSPPPPPCELLFLSTCFSAPARSFWEAAVEASLSAHRLCWVLGVNRGTFKVTFRISQNQYYRCGTLSWMLVSPTMESDQLLPLTNARCLT